MCVQQVNVTTRFKKLRVCTTAIRVEDSAAETGERAFTGGTTSFVTQKLLVAKSLLCDYKLEWLVVEIS